MPNLDRLWRRVLNAVQPLEFSQIREETAKPSGPGGDAQPRFFSKAGKAQARRAPEDRFPNGPPSWLSVTTRSVTPAPPKIASPSCAKCAERIAQADAQPDEEFKSEGRTAEDRSSSRSRFNTEISGGSPGHPFITNGSAVRYSAVRYSAVRSNNTPLRLPLPSPGL